MSEYLFIIKISIGHLEKVSEYPALAMIRFRKKKFTIFVPKLAHLLKAFVLDDATNFDISSSGQG